MITSTSYSLFLTIKTKLSLYIFSGLEIKSTILNQEIKLSIHT